MSSAPVSDLLPVCPCASGFGWGVSVLDRGRPKLSVKTAASVRYVLNAIKVPPTPPSRTQPSESSLDQCHPSSSQPETPSAPQPDSKPRTPRSSQLLSPSRAMAPQPPSRPSSVSPGPDCQSAWHGVVSPPIATSPPHSPRSGAMSAQAHYLSPRHGILNAPPQCQSPRSRRTMSSLLPTPSRPASAVSPLPQSVRHPHLPSSRTFSTYPGGAPTQQVESPQAASCAPEFAFLAGDVLGKALRGREEEGVQLVLPLQCDS